MKRTSQADNDERVAAVLMESALEIMRLRKLLKKFEQGAPAADPRVTELEDDQFKALGQCWDRLRAGTIDSAAFWVERAAVTDRFDQAVTALAPRRG